MIKTFFYHFSFASVRGFLFGVISFFLAAFFAPWWGSGILGAVFGFIVLKNARLIWLASFTGWFIAISLRDYFSQQSASRLLVRVVRNFLVDFEFSSNAVTQFFLQTNSGASLIRIFLILFLALVYSLFFFSCGYLATVLRNQSKRLFAR